MTASQCATCSRPVSDATICTTCMDRLLQGLGDVPALAEDLDLTLRKRLPQGGLVNLNPTSENRTGDRPELGVQIQAHPYNTLMSDALATIRVTLTTWVRDFIDHQPEPAPPDTLAGMSRWLMVRVERVRRHPAAADISDEILHAVALCWAAVDLAPDRSWYHVGPCPETYGVDPCPGQINAYFTEHPTMVCTYLPEQHVYDATQFDRAGRRIMARVREMKAG